MYSYMMVICAQVAYAPMDDFVTLLQQPQVHTRSFVDKTFIQQIEQQSKALFVFLSRSLMSL